MNRRQLIKAGLVSFFAALCAPLFSSVYTAAEASEIGRRLLPPKWVAEGWELQPNGSMELRGQSIFSTYSKNGSLSARCITYHFHGGCTIEAREHATMTAAADAVGIKLVHRLGALI